MIYELKLYVLEGDIAVQCLALLPHRKKAAVLILTQAFSVSGVQDVPHLHPNISLTDN